MPPVVSIILFAVAAVIAFGLVIKFALNLIGFLLAGAVLLFLFLALTGKLKLPR